MECMIPKLRNLRGFSQKDLAEACHVSQQAISRIETGIGEPSYSLAVRIAAVLDCTIDELYDGKEVV